MPKHNVEGVTEKELRLRGIQDKASVKWYKKRHRKDLTPDEVVAIVSATE